MTQTLDMHEQIAELGRSPAAAAPASKTRADARNFGTFAVTFGIAFAILYTLFERMNWPLFTYHPAVGKLDFWMHEARNGEGPPMYWYGWVLLAGAAALVVSWIASKMPLRSLQRATAFCCVLAVLWPASYALANVVADRASFDADFLKSAWVAAIPAFLLAAGAGYLLPARSVERAWTGWLLAMPILGLIVLGYSLNGYFLR